MTDNPKEPKEPKEPMKRFILECQNNVLRRIEIPASWKITFGPMIPGAIESHHKVRQTWALRIYETKEKQRAIFTDVLSFRDDSISIEQRRKTPVEVIHHKPTGEEYTKEEIEGEWVKIYDTTLTPELKNPEDVPKAASNEVPF